MPKKISHTKKRSQRKNKTRKNVIHTAYSKKISSNSFIVKTFLEMLNAIKLYHWKTMSYAQHKATDELHESLSSSVDNFVEILMGKEESRIYMIEKEMKMYDFSNIGDFKELIYLYREFLIQMSDYLHPKKDTDLLNIRDEMLGNINKFLYLITLN